MFAVYGKRTETIWYPSRRISQGPDKTFRALDAHGERVTVKANAITFETREAAQEWIDKHKWHKGVIVEIRKF